MKFPLLEAEYFAITNTFIVKIPPFMGLYHKLYNGASSFVDTRREYDPKNNPYSFEVGGEVEQIFSKYGFTWGIYWKSGYKDYMHFSFFGT